MSRKGNVTIWSKVFRNAAARLIAGKIDGYTAMLSGPSDISAEDIFNCSAVLTPTN